MVEQQRIINRHKIVVIQAYCIIALLVFFGGVIGFVIGRVTAPENVKTVTVTKTVEVPVQKTTPKIPEVEVAYYNVPLSHDLQDYIYEVCDDEGVPPSLIIAMIKHESNFDPKAVSPTNDYGLMQINKSNHSWLKKQYQVTDMLDPYQNVLCGIKLVGSYLNENNGDYHKALMCYSLGTQGAKRLWNEGYVSNSYSMAVLDIMVDYEQEMKEYASYSENER